MKYLLVTLAIAATGIWAYNVGSLYPAIDRNPELDCTVAGHTPVKGYYDAAVRYEKAMQRGDINSPDVIGQDPANFGYPPENMNPQLTRNVQ